MPLWPFKCTHVLPTGEAPEVPVAIEPELRTESYQWTRVESIVQNTIATVESVRQMQVAAATQLDAAGYTLTVMLSELTAVMRLPVPAHTADIIRLELPMPSAAKPAKDAAAA